jgi:MinD superfamily P-loop ATPase
MQVYTVDLDLSEPNLHIILSPANAEYAATSQ